MCAVRSTIPSTPIANVIKTSFCIQPLSNKTSRQGFLFFLQPVFRSYAEKSKTHGFSLSPPFCCCQKSPKPYWLFYTRHSINIALLALTGLFQTQAPAPTTTSSFCCMYVWWVHLSSTHSEKFWLSRMKQSENFFPPPRKVVCYIRRRVPVTSRRCGSRIPPSSSLSFQCLSGIF